MSEHDWDLTRPIGPSRPLPPPPESPRRGAPAPRGRGLAATLGLTVLNAVLPGTAFLAAGRRRLGALVLVVFLLLVGGAAWLATAGQRAAAQIAVDASALVWVFGGIVVLGLLWVVVVVGGYRALLSPRTSRGGKVLGGVLVAALVAGIAYPVVTAGQVALAQRGLIDGLFADRESATVTDGVDPFGDQERVNVLLLGGDGGEGREGVRTDTVIVASIDTDTGDTTLFSLPRNLEDLPFPADSPLGDIYPDGFDAGSESESLLNAVYRNGPRDHPDVLGPTDDPGADFLKLGVGEALGLDIHYFVLVNLDGFSRLVDALGGITVDVNYWVPINGNPGTGELPDDYIEPGPDQRMDGARALAFARGRFGLTDYDRMARQRCTINAIIEAADPVTLLERYQELAATTQDIVSTDIPRSALDDFVDLGFLVKDAEVRSVVFDDTVINPAYPDYDRIRAIVEEALTPAPADDAAADGTPTPAPATGSPTPEPGPDQRMDGQRALAFARGRFGLTDYDRMARQRCTINAIIEAADPVTLLERYQELAATTQDIVSTDIPRSALDDFVDLGFLVKDAEVRSVVFDDTVINPAYPDYDRIRAIVDEALDPAPAADDAANGTATPTPTPTPTPAPPSPTVAPGVPTGEAGAVTNVTDACAYDPARAAEARAAGEPPNQAD